MNEDTLTPEVGPGRPDAGPRRLVRTPDGKLAGVAAGIGHYLGVDPTIVRIAFIVLAFAGGIGLLLYGACWLAMPKGEADDTREPSTVDPWTAVGIVGLVAGVGLLVGWHGIGDVGRVALAVALVVGGVLLIGRSTSDGGGAGDGGTPVTPPPPPPEDGDADEGPDVEPPDEPSVEDAAEPGEQIVDPEAATAASAGLRRAPLTALVVAILSIGLAAALFGDLDGRFDVGWSTALAAGLVVVGVGLAVASATGGAPWLFPIGLVLALALLTAAVTEPIADRGVGSRSHTVLTATALQPEYRLGVGELVVDLSALDVGGSTRAVEVRLGIGSAEVVVPPRATVDLRGHVGAGRLEAPDGSSSDGIGRDLDVVDPGAPGGGTIVVELEVGMGEGAVRRG
jgi:phage shock protein PspC (stress-responsive transcriptional regulator)